ncbi:MAG: hypothetical protein IMW94_04420 [Thermoanaerobacter sp.]|nr:hypothetical protein [Thermoanaerobacter sp.]
MDKSKVRLVIGPDDIQEIRPGWTVERAEKFLIENNDGLYEEIYRAAMQVIRDRLPEEKVRPDACRGCVDGPKCGYDPEKCPLASAEDDGSGRCANWANKI